MDDTFKYATGWLGMTPTEAKKCPICEIYLALDGKLKYAKTIGPFFGGPVIEDKPKLDVADQVRQVFGVKK